MTVITCENCGVEVTTQRRTRRFCSPTCANRSQWRASKTRTCRHCGGAFEVRSAADANRQHCSRQCAKNHNAKRISSWWAEHPEQMKVYRQNQLERDPGYWRDRSRNRRAATVAFLGGRCVVCGVDNPLWLHVDYIPTGRGERYRHPRHFAFVSRHPELFRLLCANHHYELTLTGRIEGTTITQ